MPPKTRIAPDAPKDTRSFHNGRTRPSHYKTVYRGKHRMPALPPKSTRGTKAGR